MKADLSHELTTNSLKFDFNHFFTVDSKCLLSTKLYGGKLNFASLPNTHTQTHLYRETSNFNISSKPL